MESGASDVTFNLETVRRRLGDIAALEGLLDKTKGGLNAASESLHLDVGDLAEFEHANALVAALLPVVERADAKAKDACTISAELLHDLKEFASQMHAGPPYELNELEKPETECILSTSLTPCLSSVQEAAKEAITILENPERETLELRARAYRVLRATVCYSLGLLYLLSVMGWPTYIPFLAQLLITFGILVHENRRELSLLPILLQRGTRQALKGGEREQAIRKDAHTALKRVHLISTHIASLRIPERINSELVRSEPFGIPPGSEAWLKEGDELQETINLLQGSQKRK